MIKKITIGVIAGFVSGFFGAGGGLIVVPSFIHIFKMDEKVSRGTAIFAILPMVIASGIFYVKSNYIDYTLAIKCAVGGIIGGIIGAKLLKKVSDKFLRSFFIIFLFFVSIKMLVS